MPATTTIRVDAGSPGGEIPSELFGAFLEPIGNSIDNGLMAQILINPSLEAGLWNRANIERLYRDEPALLDMGFLRSMPLPWLPWDSRAGNRYEVHSGSAANSYQSLELIGTPDAQVGIMQRVFLPVHRTREYLATAFVKPLSGTAEVTFALRLRNGRIVARATARTSSGAWQKVSVRLQLASDAPAPFEKVDFGLFLTGDDRVEVDQVTLTPADAVDGFDPDVLALSRRMGMTELRFGGNVSSYYHWRDGIGNPDTRRTTINAAWGIPEYNNFGTDEFLKLCRDLHVTPQFNVNMGSGTPQEAGDWVRYVKSRYAGHLIWELGNELWGPWQIGPPAAAQVPARTEAFSKAVRLADPDAEIIATGETPLEFEPWDKAQLGLPVGTFDELSLHFVETRGRDAIWQPRSVASTLMVYAETYNVGQALTMAQKQIDQTAHEGKAHLAMTEWLFNSMGSGEGNFTDDFPAWNNMGGAVAAAGFLETLLRHTSDVKVADMTGMIEFAGIAKHREHVYAQPAFYVFEMFSQVKGERLLSSTSDSGKYRITDSHYGFPNPESVPYVDAVATINPNHSRVSVFLVNRSMVPTAVRLQLNAWPAVLAQCTEIAPHGESSDSTFLQNTDVAPDLLVPHVRSVDVRQAFSLPAQSVSWCSVSH